MRLHGAVSSNRAGTARTWTASTPIHTFTDIDMWNNMDDVAALLRALDLLISAGTAVQVLGGSVGVPTWLFWVNNISWPCLGTDYWPWMPSVRLFPRTLEHSWEPTIDRMREELDILVPTLGT